LIIKVPERKLMYVFLANTPALNDRYDIIGDLDPSPWAREFLDAFMPTNDRCAGAEQRLVLRTAWV